MSKILSGCSVLKYPASFSHHARWCQEPSGKDELCKQSRKAQSQHKKQRQLSGAVTEKARTSLEIRRRNTWLKVCHSWPNAFYNSCTLMAKDYREESFLLRIGGVDVSRAHTRGHYLQSKTDPSCGSAVRA